MHINKLEVTNFKKFAQQTFELHPQFTLFVGHNGAGKTSVLDALAVAMGIWLTEITDTTLLNSRRSIVTKEIRLESFATGDRAIFLERLPVVVTAEGSIGTDLVSWTRQISKGGKNSSDRDAQKARKAVAEIVTLAEAGKNVLCPVLAYYGAGRAWLASNKRDPKAVTGPVRRWSAFYDCFNERIRFAELTGWFERETTAAGNRQGRMRPGFEVVRRAIVNCVPQASGIWFDADREEIVLKIDGVSQPFSNLSAGQRMMLALVADIAIKAITQNAYLLPPDELGPEDEPVPRILRETPGIVLIDELDVHLHPEWQRQVATDLKRTFPAIQFVCTSHSPQVIGELYPEEIRVLADDGSVSIPPRSFGIDSSRILEEVMEGQARNHEVEMTLQELARLIDAEDFPSAHQKLTELEGILDANDPDVTHHRALLAFMEAPLCEPS